MIIDEQTLLEEAVKQGFPTVILTAHAVNPDALMASVREGAISDLANKTLVYIDFFMNIYYDLNYIRHFDPGLNLNRYQRTTALFGGAKRLFCGLRLRLHQESVYTDYYVDHKREPLWLGR